MLRTKTSDGFIADIFVEIHNDGKKEEKTIPWYLRYGVVPLSVTGIFITLTAMMLRKRRIT